LDDPESLEPFQPRCECVAGATDLFEHLSEPAAAVCDLANHLQ
jgi:hypothetical protein